MTLTPLLEATPAIQIHAFTVGLAVVAGLLQLVGPKGTFLHRIIGYVWAGAMLLASVSSLFVSTIKQFGPFSLIHLISIYVIFAVPYAIVSARRGKIRAHKITMLNIMFWGLGVAGAFAILSPHRIMHQVLFGG